MNAKLIFVHALSPLHAGTGRSVDVIDLPIAREKATNLPYLPGSSLKGVMRDQFPDVDDSKVPDAAKILPRMLFGTTEKGGAAIFSDQRLLLLPVRSLYGTFAWVTSPYVLRRFVREATAAGCSPPVVSNADHTQVAQKTVLAYENKVYLEDLDLPVQTGAEAWADWLATRLFADQPEWQTMLRERLCIVPDDILNFLLVTATEITARISLDDKTGIVKQGGLWYEEALPSETVLVGLLAINTHMPNEETTVVNAITNASKEPLQLGGNATVGRGLCRVAVY